MLSARLNSDYYGDKKFIFIFSMPDLSSKFSEGRKNMDTAVLSDQQKYTFISFVSTLGNLLKTHQEWWLIGTDGVRKSKESVLLAHDDDICMQAKISYDSSRCTDISTVILRMSVIVNKAVKKHSADQQPYQGKSYPHLIYYFVVNGDRRFQF